MLVAAPVLALGLVLGACGTRRGERAGRGDRDGGGAIGASASLPGGVIARVGEIAIERSLVAEVARARHISAEEATRILVDEAYLSAAARRHGGESDFGMPTRLASVLVRRLNARYMAESDALGPFTPEEVEKAMGDQWVELSRPETRSACHALVRAGARDGAAVAQQLHDLLAPIADATAFMEAANKFQKPEGVEITVEGLPTPFTVDGRLAAPGAKGEFDPTFARAAFEIPHVGGTSPVVETKFGWHVVRLLEIKPPYEASFDEKVRRLRGPLVRGRVGKGFDAMLEGLRAATPAKLFDDPATLGLPRVESGGQPR